MVQPTLSSTGTESQVVKDYNASFVVGSTEDVPPIVKSFLRILLLG